MKDKLGRLIESQKKILFVGIGNVLKHDDGVGIYICDQIIEKPPIQKLSVELSIENYIGKINAIKPDVLVLIDSVLLGKQAGYADLIPVEQLIDRTSHTHNISLNKIGKLFHMPVEMLGIEPSKISFGEGLTPVVKNTADEIISYINKGPW